MKFWVFSHDNMAAISPKNKMGYKQPVLLRITSRRDSHGNLAFKPLEFEHEFSQIHQIHFDDVFSELENLWQSKGLQYKTISQEQANNIFQYYLKNKNDGADAFFVHCDAGISRSAAIAISLMEYEKKFPLVEKVLSIRKFIPNHTVWEKMRIASGWTEQQMPYEQLFDVYKQLNITLHSHGLNQKNLF